MFRDKIEKLVQKHASSESFLRMKVEYPPKKEYGDYSIFLPLEEAKYLKQKIEEEKPHFVKEIKVIPPGFLNFYIKEESLLEAVSQILQEKESFGSADSSKTAVVDYSSPNIAKPFGIGHLRSTIIGQALYNIYEFLGWNCIGDNHLGDWGTQFGSLIYQIKKEGIEEIENLTTKNLEQIYIRFHQEAAQNPEIKEKAKEWFNKLEKGDKEAERIWKICKDISIKEFDKIYDLLNIKIDKYLGESFYQEIWPQVIQEARKKNLVEESEGALIIKYPNQKFPPALLLKSDGSTTYFTRDLAAVKYRLQEWNPELFIYEVGADQALHLQQLFEAVEMLGWCNKDRFIHVAHGLIRSPSGKFSTRKGETIHLEEVLKEAIEKAKEIIKSSETNRDLNQKEVEELSKKVGIGAIKYNDLASYHSRDIVFDWNKILNLKGNSGPYIQYTYARCKSIMRKAEKELGETDYSKFLSLFYENAKGQNKTSFNEKEEALLGIIYQFPEIVADAAKKFSPNLICNFAFDLSKKYNLFYSDCPVLKTDKKETIYFRLALTAAVAQLLKNSLSLLGIEAPEKL